MLDTATESHNNMMNTSGYEANLHWPGAWIPPPQPQSSAWPNETSNAAENSLEKEPIEKSGYESENLSEEDDNEGGCEDSDSEET